MRNIYTDNSWFKSRVLFSLCIFFITGLVATLAVLYYTMHHDIGPTYAMGIKMLTALKQDIFYKALIIFGNIFLFMIIGILLLALLYSHRIAEPLYRLTQFVTKIIEGHLNERVSIRDKDIIQPVAAELNALVNVYHHQFQEIKKELQALEILAAGMDESEESLSEIKKKAKVIHQLTEQFQL